MKEQFEWIHSWCDEAANDDLPRVLLVGDSIVDGYQAKVRELLHGVCYVDFIATSYGIDTKMYATLLLAFMTDSKYALIHFNNGLHGVHITKRTYQSRLEKLLTKVEKRSKILLATSTVYYKAGNKRLNTPWMKKVKERNDAMHALAEKKGYGVDDLFFVSTEIPKENRLEDGVHYTPQGYNMLAEAVAKSIGENLQMGVPCTR